MPLLLAKCIAIRYEHLPQSLHRKVRDTYTSLGWATGAGGKIHREVEVEAGDMMVLMAVAVRKRIMLARASKYVPILDHVRFL